MIFEIRIPGQPIAKARPRFFKKGNGFIGSYNPQESEEGFWAVQAIEQLKEQGFDRPINSGTPLRVECRFLMKRPQHHFGSGKRADVLKPSAPQAHTGKPDLDNLTKFVLDCLNRVGMWSDDAQVASITAQKSYVNANEHPQTIVRIRSTSETE